MNDIYEKNLIVYLSYCQAQPQAPAQTQRGLRLALLSLNPATPPPPTRESIFQTQIDLDLKSKVVGHNG